MDIVVTKLASLVLMALGSLFFGLLPLKLGGHFFQGSRWRVTLASLLLCFGAGVLMATSLIHILPEARESFEEYGSPSHLPLAELFLSIGFFIIYLIEEIAHKLVDHHHINSDSEQHSRVNGVDPSAWPRSSLVDERRSIRSSGDHDYRTFDDDDDNNETLANATTVKVDDDVVTCIVNPTTTATATTTTTTTTTVGCGTTLKDFLTVLALSAHSLFEGLAVGLGSDPLEVWTLMGAIALHKFVIGFCVGVELLVSETRLSFYLLYMFVWMAMTPVGIACGTLFGLVDVHTAAFGLVEAALQSLAAGSLVYVVFMEILVREKSKHIAGLAQLLSLVLGFILMLGINLVGHHDH